MLDLLKEMFSYPFMVRAILVGTIVALCSSLLGVSLVLKRYSMIGDGLSHVGFSALALATALNMAPLTVSIPIVVLAAFLLLRISESSKIKGDAAIALISTGALAVGVMVISVTTGMNTDVCNYLFGSILSMSQSDVNLSVVLSVIVLVLFILFYNRIFAVTFDESFAKATGTNAGLYNMLIALLTALIICISCPYLNAVMQKVQSCDYQFRYYIRTVFMGWSYNFLCICHSHRRKHCLMQHHCLLPLLDHTKRERSSWTCVKYGKALCLL